MPRGQDPSFALGWVELRVVSENWDKLDQRLVLVPITLMFWSHSVHSEMMEMFYISADSMKPLATWGY